jgi:hypothetical protein
MSDIKSMAELAVSYTKFLDEKNVLTLIEKAYGIKAIELNDFAKQLTEKFPETFNSDKMVTYKLSFRKNNFDVIISYNCNKLYCVANRTKEDPLPFVKGYNNLVSIEKSDKVFTLIEKLNKPTTLCGTMYITIVHVLGDDFLLVLEIMNKHITDNRKYILLVEKFDVKCIPKDKVIEMFALNGIQVLTW